MLNLISVDTTNSFIVAVKSKVGDNRISIKLVDTSLDACY